MKIEGNITVIGISDYAQDSLGDIVFIEIPENGTELLIGDEITVIESVKARVGEKLRPTMELS